MKKAKQLKIKISLIKPIYSVCYSTSSSAHHSNLFTPLLVFKIRNITSVVLITNNTIYETLPASVVGVYMFYLASFLLLNTNNGVKVVYRFMPNFNGHLI